MLSPHPIPTQQAVKPQTGFTLVESMYVLLVFAILSVFAVPAMYSMIKNNAMRSAESAINSAVQLARSEAIARNRQVSICASGDGASCAGLTTSNWQQGWIVFVDDGTNAGVVDAGEALLRVYDAIGMNMTLRFVEIDSPYDNAGFIQFRKRTGALSSNGLVGFPLKWELVQSGVFRLCHSDADVGTSKAIEVLKTGRAATKDLESPPFYPAEVLSCDGA